jgi:hypothetical protein
MECGELWKLRRKKELKLVSRQIERRYHLKEQDTRERKARTKGENWKQQVSRGKITKAQIRSQLGCANRIISYRRGVRRGRQLKKSKIVLAPESTGTLLHLLHT